MRSGISIGRVFGIKIRIDWSWLFIFFLIAWSLGTSFRQFNPAWGIGLSWALAIVAALLFFISVLAHELAHSLVARSQGIPVRSITLFLFGGVSNIQREPASPMADFLIAIVGPITSLVIGAVLTLLVNVGVGPIDSMTASNGVLAGLTPLQALALWLGSINLLLGLFNLVPGFPLDGGRVLRAILWAITHSLRRATQWASAVGQIIAWLFILAGIAMIFGAVIPVLGAGFLNGLWLAFIGWFLASAAEQSYQQVVVDDILRDVPVARLMRTNPPTVPPGISVSDLVQQHVMGTDDNAFPVTEGDQLLGIVTLNDIRGVPRERWDTTTVREIMTPNNDLIIVTPEEDAADALNKLSGRDLRQLPVVQNGHLTGLLRRRDILRWLQLQSNTQMA